MYIDSGLFFHWIHLPITTQHINHLCVSDAFFKGTFHKYKPTNKFFWTCIVKLTTIRHLTWQAHSVRIISIWTQYHGQLYWLFCTKKPPKELRSENIQISSQIWQSTGKRIFFFRFRWQNATHLQLSSCFYHRFKEKRSQKDPMLTNGMQKLEIKRKKNSVCSKKSLAEFALGSKLLSY